jgi:hypothetical protein
VQLTFDLYDDYFNLHRELSVSNMAATKILRTMAISIDNLPTSPLWSLLPFHLPRQDRDMKKFISLMAILLLVPALAMAQMDELKNTTPEERAAALTKMMDSSLSLDEKTSAAVSEINLKYAKETQALMDSSGPKLGKLMTFRQNAQAKDEELKGVLSPEQYALYEQKKDEMQATMKQKMKEKYEASQ